MSFHLDLELSADCAVWREMLNHEHAVEQRSIGTLAGTFQGLPPQVLRSFLTHRHTHEKLLSPKAQQAFKQAVQDHSFSFDRNPSKEYYDPNARAATGTVYSMTHGSDEVHSARTHLPKDGRLHYLYPPDHLNRMNLHPRAAKSYAHGKWHESHLAMAEKPSNPHPGFKTHPETSTYRRVTTGRRHVPFPARIRGEFYDGFYNGMPSARSTYVSKDEPEEKDQSQSDAQSSYLTPPDQPITRLDPHAPVKPQRLHAPLPSPQSFPPLTTPSSSSASARPSSNSSLAAKSVPSLNLPVAPVPSAPSHLTRLPASAGNYIRAYSRDLPSNGVRGSPRSNATQGTGFAEHAQMYETNRSAEPLLQTVPTSYAAYANHKYDHTASFGSNGVFRAVPSTKVDHGLHASHRLW